MASLERNQPSPKFPREILDAINANRVWQPQDIGFILAVRAGEVIGVQEMAKELRAYSKKLDVSDDAMLADQLIGLTRAMVDRLNWLARAGKLDGTAPRNHETWPINYAPDASKGASKWEAAKELYQKLGCGGDACFVRIAGQMSWSDRWTKLVECGVRAALLAKHKATWVDEQIRKPKLCVHSETWQGRTNIEGDYYLCRNGEVIVWPSWAEQSRGLPDKLTGENWKDFLTVVRLLVRIYLIEDPNRMLEYLNAVTGNNRLSEWNSDVFNNAVMPRIKDALETLAKRA
jgi:hypothetical protein